MKFVSHDLYFYFMWKIHFSSFSNNNLQKIKLLEIDHVIGNLLLLVNCQQRIRKVRQFTKVLGMWDTRKKTWKLASHTKYSALFQERKPHAGFE